MIKVGDTHTIQHDSRQWILIHHASGRIVNTDKYGGKKVLGSRTYYGRLGGVLDQIINDSMKGAESVEELAQKLSDAHRSVSAVAQEVTQAIYDAGGATRQATGIRADSINGAKA